MAIAKLVKPVKVNNVTTSIKEFSKGDSFTLKGDGTSEAAEIVLNNTANTFSTTIKSAEVTSNITFTLPDNDGSNGQVLRTDGNGNLTFVNEENATVLADDSSPQLGGNLDVNGNSIVSISNADVSLLPDGTGTVLIDGDGTTGGITLESGSIDVKNSGAVSNIKFYDENNSNYIQLQSAPHSSYSGNVTLTLPTTSGSLITSENVVSETTKDFVATGTIATGDIVGLRSDGTVEVIADVSNTQTENVGTSNAFETNTTIFLSSVYDPVENKILIAYRVTGTNVGTAVVGTVSGTSISFGATYNYNNVNTSNVSTVYDSSQNKLIISYRNEVNNYGYSVVGTVSGTTLSFGTPVVFSNNIPADVITSTFDTNSNKVVIAYNNGALNRGYAVVGTVSGTSISFGTPVQYHGSEIVKNNATFDTNSNKVVIAYSAATNYYGSAIVGTVSGTSISFGTPVVFASTAVSSYTPGIVFDSFQNKIVIAYRDSSNSGKPTAIVGTVSGTSISFGNSAVFDNTTALEDVSLVFDSYVNRVVITYKTGTTHGYAVPATITGTTISFGTPITLQTGSVYISSTFDSSQNKVVHLYSDSTNSQIGTAVVYTTPGTYTTTNAASWIGIAKENISNTATGEIILISSVVDGLSSLTTGADYFVNYDGTLTATENAGPVTGTYGKIGRAISTTKLLITEGND